MKRKVSFVSLVTRLTLVYALICTTSPSAMALADGPWSVFFAGAYPFSVGVTHQYMDGEYGILGGFGYQEATWPIGLQFEGMTYRFGFNGKAEELASSEGYMQMTAGTANITWLPEKFKQARLKPRLIGGIGVYNRVLKTTEEGRYGGTCWDPWYGYYYCSGDTTYVTDSKSQTKFGWNVGASVGYELLGGTEFFVELRYHQAETSKNATPFMPINFGFRW